MKHKSLGTVPVILVWAFAFSVTSCASRNKETGIGSAGASSVSNEVSLTADRSELHQLRKDIPEEVKKQNDEIAMLMSFIVGDSEEEPNRLRERFTTALRKKREAVDKYLRGARENFVKREKVAREAFMKASKEKRDSYLASRKRTADDRKRFFDDQEDQRKSFFGDQQEKRKDFEMRVQDERKNLEDSLREKQNAFNQEWRSYQARYNERKKQNELKAKMESKSRDLESAGRPRQPVTKDQMSPEDASGIAPTSKSSAPEDVLAEFDKIPPGPATPLVPGRQSP